MTDQPIVSLARPEMPGEDTAPPPQLDSLPSDDVEERSDADERFRRRLNMTEPAEDDTQPKTEWISPTQAFLGAKAKEPTVVAFPIDRLNGFRTKLLLRSIPTKKYRAIVDQFTITRRDPSTGAIVEETKEEALKAELIRQATVKPAQVTDALREQFDGDWGFDWDDPELYSYWGTNDPHVLVDRVLGHGEVENAAIVIARICGHERTFLQERAGNS